jgi:hypothetical protein
MSTALITYYYFCVYGMNSLFALFCCAVLVLFLKNMFFWLHLNIFIIVDHVRAKTCPSPCHEIILRSQGIAPLILSLSTRWR